MRYHLGVLDSIPAPNCPVVCWIKPMYSPQNIFDLMHCLGVLFRGDWHENQVIHMPWASEGTRIRKIFRHRGVRQKHFVAIKTVIGVILVLFGEFPNHCKRHLANGHLSTNGSTVGKKLFFDILADNTYRSGL